MGNIRLDELEATVCLFVNDLVKQIKISLHIEIWYQRPLCGRVALIHTIRSSFVAIF
jgi:hypothetical protein